MRRRDWNQATIEIRDVDASRLTIPPQCWRCSLLAMASLAVASVDRTAQLKEGVVTATVNKRRKGR